MIDPNQLDQINGSTVYDQAGNKIGKAGQVYLDDATGQPEWLTVNTGLFGTNESFVPLRDATQTGDGVTIAYDKDMVKDAPNVSADGHLSEQEGRELYAYYNLGGSDQTMTGDVDNLGAGNVSDDSAMTRSEERMDVGTKTEQVGRARLRKYVVTENVTTTVPVRKEKAVLEREPITEENRGEALGGQDITESEHEVVLHEERPVVQTTVEPVERVRLGVEEVETQEEVTGQVRKERIEADGVDDSAAGETVDTQRNL